MFGYRRHDGDNASNGRSRKRGKPETDRKGGGSESLASLLQAIGNITRGQLFYFADRYRNEAAQLVDDFAGSLREVGSRHDNRGDEPPLADVIADDLEDLSDVIRDIRLSATLSKIEHLARRRPVVFGLGAIAAGYVITKVVARDASGGGRRGARF